MNQHNQLEDVLTRLARIEASHKRLKLGVTGAGVALIVAVLVAMNVPGTDDWQDTIRVRQLFTNEIRLYEGPQTRVHIRSDGDGGAGVYVQDAKGHWRAALRSIEGGDAGLYVADKEGTLLTKLTASGSAERSEGR